MKNKIRFFAAVIVVAGSVLTTACGKKDGGSASIPAAPVSPLGSCAVAGACSGVANPALLASAGATASSMGIQVDFAFDLVGDTTRFTAIDPLKQVVSYSGPAMVSGYIRIQASGASICSASSGEYLMQAAAQGAMQMGVLTNARMVSTTGPNANRIEATIIQATIYNSQDPLGTNRNSATNRLGMTLRLDSVNGQPCNAVITTY